MSQTRTAIARHLEYLTQHWSRTEIPFDRIVMMAPKNVHLSDLGTIRPVEVRIFRGHLPPLMWEQWALPRAAKTAAVLFSEYTSPLAYRGRVVVANHGIYEAIPDTFSLWTRLRATPINRRSAQRANCVIANSQNTKADLIKYFGVPESRIDVIYPGPAELFFQPHTEESTAAETVRVFGRRVPYVIFVGKLVRRRHVPNLIEAFARVRKQHDLPHHLLIVGPNVASIPIDDFAERHGIKGLMRYIPHLDQQSLAKLYTDADLFILPTTYEGISWTMFEAMASGTAVLTVDHPVLAEGGADAVYSVPTPEVPDLARGMAALLTDPSLRRTYQRKGRLRACSFSMRECAKATMEVLDRVALPADQ